MRWYRVPVQSMARTHSEEHLAKLELKMGALEEARGGQLLGGQQPTAKEEEMILGRSRDQKQALGLSRELLVGLAAGSALGAIVALSVARLALRR